VSKEAYSARSIKQLMRDYFSGSPQQLLSFFIEREKLDTKELDAILKLIKTKKTA
jgi:predicted transcriptional regulator